MKIAKNGFVPSILRADFRYLIANISYKPIAEFILFAQTSQIAFSTFEVESATPM